jgi:autotransporter-associated beta strand protein
MRLNHRAIAPLSLLLFLTCASTTQAATYTWTGAGMTNNWSNGANWQGGAAPSPVADGSPDTLIFPAGTLQTTMNNDFPMDTQFAALEFRAGYVLNGNRIVLGEGIVVQVPLFGLVDVNTALRFDSDAAGVPVTVQTNTTLRLSGPINGQSGLRKTGAGTLHLDGIAGNTFGGPVTVVGGKLAMEKALAVPSGLVLEGTTASYVAVDAIAGGVTVNAPGKLEMDGFNDTIASLNGNGTVQLATAVLTINNVLQSSFFGGVFIGPGGLVKDGPSTFVLTNDNPAFGAVTINAGSFGLRGAGALASNVTLNGGRLFGGGPLGSLNAVGGRIEPGTVEAPGALEPKSLTLAAGATAAFTLFSAPGGLGNDQIRVTGTVNLGNAALDLESAGTFVPFNGKLTLIDNDGTDPVIGTFANLDEGQTYARDGRFFRISYRGGTGNDVVVTSLIMKHYLSEGATGGFFDTDLVIANPNNGPVKFQIHYLKRDGTVWIDEDTVPGRSRKTIRVDQIGGLENTEVSMVVDSIFFETLIVERTMRWDPSGYGAHTEKAVGGPSTVWYFAEGAQGFFSTYLLLANPNNAANTATVEFLRENNTPIVRTYPLEPNSRFTVDAGADAELVNQSFGITVNFTVPGVAERSMYFGADPLWKAGHESAGVAAPSTTWFLAEGATGPFFETFVLMANPNDANAEVTVTFLPDTGIPITKQKTIPARGRLTINVEAEDPALANAAVATRVTSTQPVVVERAQYWPDPAPAWYEAHNSFGVTEPSHTWGLAEGRVGGPEGYQTYILLANPGDQPTDVNLTFLREGKPSFTKTFTVPPTSRFNVTTGPGSMVPELQDESFGVRIDTLFVDRPIVVERAMYSNAGGVVWSAGTNATATRLPSPF